jgi:hypothetical protein
MKYKEQPFTRVGVEGLGFQPNFRRRIRREFGNSDKMVQEIIGGA